MPEDDIAVEVERLELIERERHDRQATAVDRVRASRLGSRYAGGWRDGDVLRVGVAAGELEVEALADELQLPASIELVPVARSLTELDALARSLWAAAEQAGVVLSWTGIDASANRLEAGVDGLGETRARTLVARFTGEPIAWVDAPIADA